VSLAIFVQAYCTPISVVAAKVDGRIALEQQIVPTTTAVTIANCFVNVCIVFFRVL